MTHALEILAEALNMYVEAAPWLILGVVAAGLVHAFMPGGVLGAWLGQGRIGPVIKAALIGAPLPLCSCGVLPAAVGLRREGASKAATVSFLIATPETGPDSIAVSYALLGPVMAVVRPVAAIVSAVFAGLLTVVLTRGERDTPAPSEAPSESASEAPSCSSGCGGGCAPQPHAHASRGTRGAGAKLWGGLRYALTDIMDDIALWLAIGLLVAGGLGALVEPQGLSDIGSGLPAMGVMLLVGVPLYVCATASTPIAAGLIAAGLSPGAALVFLLAGPATNIATLGVVGKDLGPRALAAYLGGIAISAVAMGLALDAFLDVAGLDIPVQMSAAAETVPEALKTASALVLAPFFVLSLYKEAKKRVAR